MGLDQYLTAKLGIYGQYGSSGITGKIEIYSQNTNYNRDKSKYELIGEKKPIVILEDLGQLHKLVFAAAYWRKCNAVHNWFVENVQNGVDECQESYVSREDLEMLLSLVNTALGKITVKGTGPVKNGRRYENGEWTDIIEEGKIYEGTEEAGKILPTKGGFFFGSTDYDQWYVMELEETKEQLEKVLNNPLFEKCTFYYQASW